MAYAPQLALIYALLLTLSAATVVWMVPSLWLLVLLLAERCWLGARRLTRVAASRASSLRRRVAPVRPRPRAKLWLEELYGKG